MKQWEMLFQPWKTLNLHLTNILLEKYTIYLNGVYLKVYFMCIYLFYLCFYLWKRQRQRQREKVQTFFYLWVLGTKLSWNETWSTYLYRRSHLLHYKSFTLCIVLQCCFTKSNNCCIFSSSVKSMNKCNSINT